MNVLQRGEIQVAEKHHAAVTLSGKEVSREDAALRRLAHGARLLNVEAERLDILPDAQRRMTVQVVFDEGVVDQFFSAAVERGVELNLQPRSDAFAHPATPPRLDARHREIRLELAVRVADRQRRVT